MANPVSARPAGAVPLICAPTGALGFRLAQCQTALGPVRFATLLQESPSGAGARSIASGAPGTPQGTLLAASARGRDKPGLRRYRLAEPDQSLQRTARRVAQLAPPSPITAQVAPPLEPVPPGGTRGEARPRASFEDLLPALVRKVAWSGDSRRGSIRLELGAGALAGGTLLVHADDGQVRVRLSVPAGVDLDGWRERIAGRLAALGLSVEGVEVDG